MAIVIKTLRALDLARLDSTSSFATIYESSTAATLIKSIRFVNVNDTAGVLTLQLAYAASPSTPKQITATAMVVPGKGMYVERQELTLQPGDVLKAKGGVFDFVISGIERQIP